MDECAELNEIRLGAGGDADYPGPSFVNECAGAVSTQELFHFSAQPQSTTPTSKCTDFNIQHSTLVSATRTRLQYFVAIIKSSPRAIECNNANFYESGHRTSPWSLKCSPMMHLFEIRITAEYLNGILFSTSMAATGLPAPRCRL
jgi:hypothetical protein